MRYIIVYMSVFVTLFISCNGWLNVEPKNQISDQKVFKDSKSVKNALIGIYSRLSGNALYGENLTWGLASMISRDYTRTKSDSYLNQAHDYIYTDNRVKSKIKAIWSEAFSVIANTNKIINELEAQDDEFFLDGEREKDYLLGEAKAIRALMYFEVVRLFAPAPILNDDEPYIPYFEIFGSKIEPKIPTSKILEKIIADLEYAEVALGKHQVHEGYFSNYDSRSKFSYNFYQSGMFRMNYFAVVGLLSKVHLYNNNIESAQAYAEILINDYGPEGAGYYKLDQGTDLQGTSSFSSKLSGSTLFALYDEQLILKANGGFNSNKLELKDIRQMVIDSNDPDDCRLDLISTNIDNEMVSRKWKEFEITNLEYEEKIMYTNPIIRFSEAYLILAECLWISNKTKACELLNKYRIYREAKRKISTEDPDEFYREMTMEYRKEFFTEGQMFFYFKRLNKELTIESEKINMTKNFVLPIPEEETIH